MQRNGFGYEEVATDALIIGAGAAGLRAAIELAESGVRPLVLGKRRHGDAHTIWAAGGINASLGTRDPEDRWEIHAADTIREGHFVNDPRAVELLARNAPDRIRELAGWGCGFSRTEDGELDQRYFGAQSYRRTCFAGDETGEAILSTLVAKARELGVPYRENVYVTKILTDQERAVGAAGYDMESGRYLVFRAPAVVMAAGGLTALYARSSSRPDENTGDAVALAYEAGAALRDMEFVQFHPTGMVKPEELSGELVTEAVRGEGGRLLNARGERFMERYSPEHLELDARDVVARANYAEIQTGRGTEDGAVLLDISHRSPEYIRERLPRMYRQFKKVGVDITREPMEVAPTAHYAMGGVEVDFGTGATTLPGLFAIGEATAGLHGANRLGGNSLAETVVFGELTGRYLAEYLRDAPRPALPRRAVEDHLEALDSLADSGGGHDPQELIEELRSIMWDHAGIVRTGEGIRAGLDRLAGLERRAGSAAAEGAGSRSFELANNLRFMLVAAEAVLRSALARRESRGAHFREDAPEESAGWQKNIICEKGNHGEMLLRTEPVGEIPAEIQAALAEEHSLEYHHLE
ncbi:FAD-binding protein [Rubrobacter taiwanensis]|jgi:succinate dehydrogenase / fumarate reductase flavoprotein subunit|uniref:FAD-binding protein n=1 Tax=Rubrobacter taiwanensis TaxID=185139 RepID=A0A4R1BG97_9ACTN|nr:FAD-dependent oxidoreductase [Rubrobacter taiwanensis]TCJ16210.1 FAD-binding protein [Rubrobacter taiwanensis]